MAATLRFRYSLEALLRMRRRAMDSARAEESNARRVVLEKEQSACETRKLVADLEQQMRVLLSSGRILDRQQQEMLARYLATVRERLQSELTELAQAKKVHEQARLRLHAQAQKVRALERHRETKARQHSKTAASAEHKAQDELWLARVAN